MTFRFKRPNFLQKIYKQGLHAALVHALEAPWICLAVAATWAQRVDARHCLSAWDSWVNEHTACQVYLYRDRPSRECTEESSSDLPVRAPADF